MLICGMHVHVGIDDDDLRIDLLNQFSYFLPHLLALSTSSPFWEGVETGLHSYRLTVFDNLPRTGLPPLFSSHARICPVGRHDHRHRHHRGRDQDLVGSAPVGPVSRRWNRGSAMCRPGWITRLPLPR